MTALVLDEYEVDELLKRRKETRAYLWDEVWDGVYVVEPLPDNLHQEFAGLFILAFYSMYRNKRRHSAGGHVNISDRNKTWLQNVRCLDAAIFLPGNPARDRFTHWQGGPDLAVEIVMPGDRCREKLDFYAKVGTREVLVIERDPWQLELYRLQQAKMKLAEIKKPGSRMPLASGVVPFEFQFVRSKPRPKLKIVHTETRQEWIG